MKVSELIARMSKLNPEHEVVCFCEDDEVGETRSGSRVFDINHVGTTEAESTRTPDGSPGLKFGKGENSRSFAILEITSDF